MTLTIDLSPTEEALLATTARQRGLDPAVLAKALVTGHLPAPVTLPEDPTLALFAQWAQEDAQKTPEEIAQEDRLWEEFESGINETRDALGMRRL